MEPWPDLRVAQGCPTWWPACCCLGSGTCRALHAWNSLDLLTWQNGVGWATSGGEREGVPSDCSPELPLPSSQPQEQCNSPHVKSKHLAASAVPKINQELIEGICNHNRSWMGKEGAVCCVEAKADYLGILNSFVYWWVVNY